MAAPGLTPPLAAADARLRAGDAAAARAMLDAVLATADLPVGIRVQALKLRSRAHEALRNLRAAIADLEGATALAPRDAQAFNELGIVHADAGDTARAIDSFAHAVAIEPGYARAWNNLGNAQRAVGALPAAEDAFLRATRADTAYALAFANLGAMRRDRGDDAGAEAALERALALEPGQRVALLALAGLRRQQGALDAAVDLYTRAAQRDPRDANTFLQLAQTLAERDDLAAARQAYDAALARDPALLRAALGRRLTLPLVPDSAGALQIARDGYVEALAILERELPAAAAGLAPERLADELRWTNFVLAYQGGDDTALQARYGDLVARLLGRGSRDGAAFAQGAHERATPMYRAPGSRVRVGFVSAFFRDGTAGRYFERWITDLPRERFEVHVYHLNPVEDELTVRLAARADAFHRCPRWRPSQLLARLRAHALDVVVFPELGMDATTFAVAAHRIAPRQCAGWGHPVTSGLASIDVFFGSDPMEPDDAEHHYRERLVRLPGLGTRYAMPALPGDARREAFGLPEDATLLLCPQSLFKIHPDNDALFARVLAAAPRAHLALFEGRHSRWTATYLARLDRALELAGLARAGRVHVLPQCTHDDYLRINAVCDLMLDTLHWSGGNTSLDALACGLPIVTLPGRFMRGRQSAGMLREIGVGETIAADADDYVRIASALAGDATARLALRHRIAQARDALFDDPRPVAALADALETLART
jgi:CRISPR-associated protein Csy1